jgi:hypothetical protein
LDAFSPSAVRRVWLRVAFPDARPRRAARAADASWVRGAALAIGLILGLLGFELLGSPALAQDGGSIPQSIVTTAAPLSEEQRARVKSFVDAQAALLAGKDAEKASRARGELTALAVRPGASEVFLREYAAAIRAALDPILGGSDPQRAVNALIVVQSLRTPEAIELLLRFADPEQEKRLPVRIRAISSLAEAMPSASMTPVQVDGVVRRVTALGQKETNWIALHHAFRTLLRIASMPRLPDDSVNGAIRGQGDVIASLVERISREPGQSELIAALANNLNLVVREQLPTMRADRARALRTRLAKSLAQFLATIDTQWTATRAAREDLARFYASAVSVAELLLKVAASSDAQQPLDANFGIHWEAGDQSKFSADVQRARQIVDKLAVGG